jgi:serine/threonine protein kinase
MSWNVKNYQIHHTLGKGGMGTVYYAVDAQLHREVALKCLRPEVANNPGVLERFRKEAQAQAKLNHPNIAQIWEFFQVGSEHYLAMEYIDGPTLSRVLREKGRLPYEEAAGYAIETLRGLDHAHKQEIVHRDIKPANLMIDKGNHVKVTDFGIARVRGASRDTRDGMIIGTYEYISPEAAQGLDATALSDVYSMGVVLFEILTGRLPFESRNEFDLLRLHIQAARPSVRSFVKDVPGDMDDIVQRAMDRKVGRRFRSAAEMAEALQRCLDSGQRVSATGRWRRLLFAGVETARETPTPPPAIEERRRTDVSSTCHRVEDLLEQHLFNEAGSLLDAGFRSHPGEPDFIDLRNRLLRQRQQYEQAVTQQTELIRDLLNRGLSEEAMKVAGNALTMYPRAAALADLQHECRRRVDLANAAVGELTQVQGRVDEMIVAGQFQEAADYVLELLAVHENQIELNKLLARILQARKDAEKQAAIAQCVADAGRAADTGEWEPALAMVDSGLERFPGDTKLQAFRQALSGRWQAERRRLAVEAAIAEARDLEVSTSLRAASDRLTKDLDALERDPALVRELERIDAALEAARRDSSIASAVSAAAALRSERKWQDSLDLLDRTAALEGRDTRIDALRITVAAELRAHEALVARTSAAARQSIQNLQWEEAVLGLSTAMRDMPGERILNDLMQEAQRGLAQKRRDETIARIKAEAEQRAGARNYSEAIRLLLDAVSQYPEDATLSAALSQTIFERDTYIEGEKTKAALERAARLRSESRFEEAIEALLETIWDLPGNRELQSALSRLESEWREIRRRAAIEEITAVVESGIAAENYQPALDRLARGLAEWPGEPELLDLERRTRASQRQQQAREALREAIEKGTTLEAAEHWDTAAEVYERTLAAFPETASELEPRIAAARARALEAQRKARIAELQHSLAGWFEAGLLDEAEKELRGAEKEFPDEASFAAWREKIAAERQRIAREAAIRNAMDRARWLAERQTFDEAESILTDAERDCGPDAALGDLLKTVQAAKRERVAAIEAAIVRMQALFDARDWDGAISAALRDTEQFPGVARFRALLTEARQKRDMEKRAIELDRRVSRIDALLRENVFDDAETLIRNSLRDYPGEAALEERKQRLEEGRRAQALDAAFRKSVSEVERLRGERQWQQAKQLATPYLDHPQTRPAAKALLAEMAKQEAQYRARASKLMKRARGLMDCQQHTEALTQLEAAAVEFPEIGMFANMLVEIREGAAAAQRAERLSSAERTIRSLLAGQKYEEALKEADEVLGEHPDEKVFRDLRTLSGAGMRDQSAVAALSGRVEQLVASGEGTKADRTLVEGLRQYPGRMELKKLRPAVDAARKAEWDRQSREAGLKRAIAGIQKLLGQAKLAEAGAALAALEKEYGEAAAPEVAKCVADAVVETERQRLAAEERQRQRREAGLKRAIGGVETLLAQGKLAEAGGALAALETECGAGAAPETAQRVADALVEAERQRVAAEDRERQRREAGLKRGIGGIETLLAQGKLAEAGAALAALETEYGAGAAPETSQRVAAAIATAERERLAAEERERQLEAERQKQELEALDAAFRESVAEVGRLCRERQFQQARQLMTPYLDHPKTRISAEVVLAELVQQEAQHDERIRDLEKQARTLIGTKRYQEAETLIDRAASDFPENAELRRLLEDARAGRSAEHKAQSLSAAERSIRTLLAEQRFEEAVQAADAALGEYPAEATVEGLRAGIVAAIAERAAISSVAGDVQRLLASGNAARADQVLVEALRRHPGRMELEKLRAAVDAARKAEWEHQAREAALKRAISGIERLLAGGNPAEAGAALAALRQDYGDGAAAELAQRVDVAIAEAERQRLAAEERAHETERQRLAAEEERNWQLEAERRAKAMETAFRRSVGEVARLCRDRRFEQARQLVEPYLDHPRTQPSAKAVLAETVKQEAQYRARIHDLEEQARILIRDRQNPKAVALLDRAASEFPEVGEFRRLLGELHEGGI